ncbi:MAG: GNA1162 family protein [Candidatus Scalinduaceae bacterium]
MKKLKPFILLLIISAHISCLSSQQNYLNVKAIHSRARFVALISFANLTSNPQAGKIVSDLMTSELYSVPNFQMMEQTEIHEKLKMSKLYNDVDYMDSILDNISARKIGKLLGVDTVIYGSVSEYRYKMDLSEVPVVGINIRLLDVESGKILWTASKSKIGMSSWFIKDSLNSLAQKACHELVRTMLRS